MRHPSVCASLSSLGVFALLTLSSASQARAQRESAAIDRNPPASKALDVVLSRTASVNLNRASLADALTAVAASAGVGIQYQEEEVQPYTRPITLRLTKVSLGVILGRLLSGTTLQVLPDGPTHLVIREGGTTSHAFSAQGAIAGTVVDAKTRQPLSGVAVTLSGVSKSVTTNDKGMFRFGNVTPGGYTVTFRLLGYVKTSKTITIADEQTALLDAVLEPSVNALDQVVVTGTVAATEQKAVPNAITVITAKDLEQRGVTHIEQLFRGDVPGLFAVNQGTNTGLDSLIMFSRGATAFQSSSTAVPTNPIKTYLDGVELADASYMSQIDPSSIERIEILTGPQASTIYGSNAINGVMQIFTKRGSAARPQLTALLTSGLVENNFRPSYTPQHDYSAQINGTEGRWSYNTGASWNYMGPWSPGKQMERRSGYGGSRFRLNDFTADATFRLGRTQNWKRGSFNQVLDDGREEGLYSVSYNAGRSAPTKYVLDGQTLGLSLGYTIADWWSHELGIGTDYSNTEMAYTAPTNYTPVDTGLYLYQTANSRTSYRYATTARLAVNSMVNTTITLGADSWRSLFTSLSVSPLALTGTLSGTPTIKRAPTNNHGGFLQAQLGVADAFFVTYGLRAEWNPNYGDDAQPNLAPRYGVAFTREWGPMTTKLRLSYGRSTRPPAADRKLSQPQTSSSIIPLYGNIDNYHANPDLGPEFQRGGEGGMEFYFGNRGSLIVTRYNQTVDGLIAAPKADSARSLLPNPSQYMGAKDADGYGYWPIYQYLNVGSIRNQGWELQGSTNLGPLVTKATYSWTKSRVLGITPRYRAILTGTQYQPGSSFNFLAEHTWALVFTYVNAGNNVSFNVNGTGFLYRSTSELYYVVNNTRLVAANAGRTNIPTNYKYIGPGYTKADLNASHRFSPAFEGILQIQNLTDFYQNDFGSQYATMGRQTRAGVRIRL